MPFLNRLRDKQAAIRTVRQSWEALPDIFFDGSEDRGDALTLCLRAGVFRRFVRAIAGERVRRLTIISPYWDADLAGLSALRQAFGELQDGTFIKHR